MTERSDYVLRAPRWVQQTGVTCWAASLESWLEVTDRGQIARDDLIKRFATREDGGLDPRKFASVAEGVGMGWNFWTGQQIEPGTISSVLRERGHLYLVYQHSAGWAHALIAYGISTPPRGSISLWIMDPQPSQGLRKIRLADLFAERDFVVAGWPGY